MRTLIASFVAGALLCAGSAYAQNQTAHATAWANTPEIPFDSVSVLKMPAGLYVGEVVGVATNSKGGIYVITRSGESRVFEYDRNGTYVKEFGQNSFGYGFAHAVRVDKDDNVWTIDEGTNMILKYSPAGKLLMVMGKRPDAIDQVARMPGVAPFSGANRPYSFHRPTDVTWDAAGNIFISDGYTDSRIVKYDKTGHFVKSMGTRGNGVNQFNTPHGITSDAQGNIYVADRGNGRVVVLDNELNWKAAWDQYGNPWGLCTTQGPGQQYVFSTNSTGPNMDKVNVGATGEIYKLTLDGKAVGRVGKGGRAIKEFASTHTLDCRNPNEIYAAEISSWRLQKITLRGPVQPSSR